MTRIMPAIAYKALKTRFRALLDEFGGAEFAASRTRVGATALYNYGNLNSADHFPPVDVVVDLEKDCGNPVVTRELARLSGYALVKTAGGPAPSREDVAVALARFGRESSDIFSDGAAALADGHMTPGELAALSTQVDEGLCVLVALSDLLRAGAPKDAFSHKIEGGE